MAGDWIKFENCTSDKPEVVRMADLLRIDQDSVVGKLLRIWVWADLNSVSGESVSVTEAFIDRMTCKRGFAAAMRQVGWLHGQDGAISFSNFDRHNGATAKSRAMENRKKASQRDRKQHPQQCPENVPVPSGQTEGQKGGPEKRREEKREDIGQNAAGAAPAPESDTDWLQSLGQLPAYAGIDVIREHGKMVAWCAANKKLPSRRRFVNWLNRAERPMHVGQARPPQRPGINEPRGWKAYLNREYPDSVYSTGGKTEAHEWSEIPHDYQIKLAGEIRRNEESA